MSQAAEDTRFMAQALRLAHRGLESTSPNPRVGCVVVRDGQVVGQGWHRRAGEPHAEPLALADAGERARGATVYVTLEPCSHHGRTPPCAEALVGAGVARVVVAAADTNPLARGGLARLREAGIQTTSGVLEQEARALNAGFHLRVEQGRPLLRCKLAMSLDGRTAMASGESRWITGEAARLDVQRLRARSCAILTGSGTVQADDPRLDVRIGDAGVQRQPLRVVVDGALRTGPAARVLAPPGRALLAHARQDAVAERALRDVGAALWHLPGHDGHVDLPALLAALAAREQCNEVLLEAGAGLAGAFATAGLVDEYVIYVAPTLLGSRARPLLDLPFDRMEQKLGLEIREVRAVGQDWRITAAPRRGAAG